MKTKKSKNLFFFLPGGASERFSEVPKVNSHPSFPDHYFPALLSLFLCDDHTRKKKLGEDAMCKWEKCINCFLPSFPVKMEFTSGMNWMLQPERYKCQKDCEFVGERRERGAIVLQHLGWDDLLIPVFGS